MLVGYAEGLGAARSYAARTGEDIDANKELVALGAEGVHAVGLEETEPLLLYPKVQSAVDALRSD